MGNVTPEQYQITAILMQDNFSEWPIYIHFIAYNETLLLFRENNLSLCLKLAISNFILWYDWQNCGLHRKLLWHVQKAICPKPLNPFT